MPLEKQFMQFLKPTVGKRLAAINVTLAFLMSGMAMPHAGDRR